MQRWLELNLIYFLDFYFMLTFLVGTYRRFGQYQNIGRLAFAGPQRWPRLLQLMREHHMVFLTWTTVLPLALALGLSVVQLIASRLVWPEAGQPPYGLTVGVLLDHWPALFLVVPLAIGMFGV